MDLQLTMIIPSSTAVKIAEARDPRLRVDPRKSLTDLLEDEVRRLGVKELHIDRVSEQGIYSASLLAARLYEGVYIRLLISVKLLACALSPTTMESDDATRLHP